MKTCTKCGVPKEEGEFEFRKDTQKLRDQCHECASIRKQKYIRNNREKSLASARKTAKKRRDRDPDTSRRTARDWNRAHRPSIRAYVKKKYHGDASFRMAACLSSRLYHAVKGDSKKSAPTQELLGCPLIWLQIHLGSLFKPGMTMDNYGKVWHIDHKRPCSSFDLTDPKQQKLCCNWTNLQPLFAQENFLKNDFYDASSEQSSKEIGSRCCQASARR